MTGLLLLLSAAVAQGLGQSADVELLSPGFGPGALPGVTGITQAPQGTVRAGLHTGYSRDPLILWRVDEGQERGAVVAHRWTSTVGVAVQPDRRVGLHASMPVMAQWGTELTEYAGDGVGTGDAALAIHWVPAQGGRGHLGGIVGLSLPTAPADAWMGERDPRTQLGLAGGLELGSFVLRGASSVHLRKAVDASPTFFLGSQLGFEAGVRHPVRGRVHAFSSLVSRVPLNELERAGSLEGLAGLQLLEGGAPVDLDLGIGRGLGAGYGTTSIRLFAAVTWTRGRRAEAPEPVAVVVLESAPLLPEPLEPEAPVEEELPEEPAWKEEELARVEGERIVIRDPIQFEFDTERLLPESLPVLSQVSGILRDNPQIAHLVIEGHASEEGSDAYNYDLSIRRARSVWEQLVRGGVHLDRLSYRGMGEVMPAAVGSATDLAEGELAASRRVEFHIVSQLHPLDPVPPHRDVPRAPWTPDASESSEEAETGAESAQELPPDAP